MFGPDDAFLTAIIKLLGRLPIYPMFGNGQTRLLSTRKPAGEKFSAADSASCSPTLRLTRLLFLSLPRFVRGSASVVLSPRGRPIGAKPRAMLRGDQSSYLHAQRYFWLWPSHPVAVVSTDPIRHSRIGEASGLDASNTRSEYDAKKAPALARRHFRHFAIDASRAISNRADITGVPPGSRFSTHLRATPYRVPVLHCTIRIYLRAHSDQAIAQAPLK
jgi:hypothetical protein